MKPRFNLSEIMRNAHELFKSRHRADHSIREGMTFAYCLCEAWKAAKGHIGRVVSVIWMWGYPTAKVQESPETGIAIAAEYATGTNGRRNFGD